MINGVLLCNLGLMCCNTIAITVVIVILVYIYNAC